MPWDDEWVGDIDLAGADPFNSFEYVDDEGDQEDDDDFWAWPEDDFKELDFDHGR